MAFSTKKSAFLHKTVAEPKTQTIFNTTGNKRYKPAVTFQ